VFDNNGSFLLAMFEFFIFFAYLMCLFWIFGDVFRSRDIGGGAKTLWVLFIIVLPFLGMLLYLIVRGNGMSQRAVDSQKEMQKAQVEYARAVVGQDNASAASAGPSASEQIASAKALLDQGTITEAEFAQIKSKALA
jgi:uncharacterized SAM-binding protein YcdF (DUF218 family)